MRSTVIAALAISALLTWTASAEMGPCRRDNQESSYCGDGDGAARIIPNTTSPSHRLALAWRLTNRPPTTQPSDNDPDLESLIVRIEDGAILAKSRGFYWHLGARYAPRQYFRAAWSPDSRLLIRTAGRVGAPDSAELFAFAEDDRMIGPFDLTKLFDAAARAQMEGIEHIDQYTFGVTDSPALFIDDKGTIHGSVYMKAPDSGKDLIYDLTAQVISVANSLDARVLSVSQYLGPYISVIVH
jgi:hypothetical protein